MASKYIDPTAIMQVIGCVYNTPQLLDYTDKYTIVDEDFVEPFHKKYHSYLSSFKMLCSLQMFLKML